MDPPVPTLRNEATGRYYACASRDSTIDTAFNVSLLSYNGLLILTCLYFAAKTQTCWAVFNESQSLGMAIYSTLFMGAIAVLFRYTQALSTTFLISNSLNTAFYLGGSMLLQTILFIPRLFQASKESRQTTTIKDNPTTARSTIIDRKESFKKELELRYQKGIYAVFPIFKKWIPITVSITKKKNLIMSIEKVNLYI
jgi:hypothetical protein